MCAVVPDSMFFSRRLADAVAAGDGAGAAFVPAGLLSFFGPASEPLTDGDKFMGGWIGFSSTALSEGFIEVQYDCVLSNFYVAAVTGFGGGLSTTYTVRVDGVDTALTCTIAMGASPYRGNDTTHTVAVTAGQRVSVKWDHNGGGASGAATFITASVKCVPTSGTRQPIGFGCDGSSPSTSQRFLIHYGACFSQPANATEFNMVVPRAGTLRNLRVRATTAPTGVGTITYTVRVNGVDTGITCQIAHLASPHAGQDLVNSVSVNKNDRVSLSIVHSVLPATNGTGYHASVEYESTTGFVHFATSAIGSLAGMRFLFPWGGSAAVQTAECAIVIPFNARLSHLFVRPRVVGSGSDVATFVARAEGVSTALTVAHTESSVSSEDATNTADVTAGTVVAMGVTTSASVSGTDYEVVVDVTELAP